MFYSGKIRWEGTMQDYVTQKQQLLDAILENTKAQSQAIEKDQPQTLEELIADRENLMQQVDSLDNSFEQKTLHQAFKETLQEIITIDNANQVLVKQELDNVKDKLKEIRIGRQQEANYGVEYGTYKEEGIFFDTKE